MAVAFVVSLIIFAVKSCFKPVRPDDGMKSSQKISKAAQNIAHYSFYPKVDSTVFTQKS